MTIKQHQQCLKAARVYLEMRGYKLQEQGWGRGANRLDLIVTDISGTVGFVGLDYAPENGQVDAVETTALIERLKRAGQTWITENKYGGIFKYLVLEIYGNGYNILNFIEV